MKLEYSSDDSFLLNVFFLYRFCAAFLNPFDYEILFLALQFQRNLLVDLFWKHSGAFRYVLIIYSYCMEPAS